MARRSSGSREGAATERGGGPIELSIVVPCLNEADTVGESLSSLVRQRWDGSWELVFADNGSTDGTLEVARRFKDDFERLRIVDASARQGRSFAANAGAREARGESLAFLDADDVAAPGWLGAVGEALRRVPFVASRHDTVELNPPETLRVRGNPQSDGLQRLWYPPYCRHAGGCGLGVRRSLFLEVGGFDEELPVLEDTDLCVRIQKRGVRLEFVGEAIVYVRYRSTPGETFRQARSWACYNELLYRRHRPENAEMEGAWAGYWAEWKEVLGLATRWRHLGSKMRRMSLAWRIGWQLGLLQGAVNYRVRPLPYRETESGSGGGMQRPALDSAR